MWDPVSVARTLPSLTSRPRRRAEASPGAFSKGFDRERSPRVVQTGSAAKNMRSIYPLRSSFCREERSLFLTSARASAQVPFSSFRFCFQLSTRETLRRSASLRSRVLASCRSLEQGRSLLEGLRSTWDRSPESRRFRFTAAAFAIRA